MKGSAVNRGELFKGIALFTPGGDLIYGIDPSKQSHWHLNLCVALQEILGLPEPPHFLVPSHIATVDRWFDVRSQQLQTVAEIYPAVQRYQGLLNVIFGLEDHPWQIATWQEELCNPMLWETYRHRFPQLWENHDLIVLLEGKKSLVNSISDLSSQTCNPYAVADKAPGYVLRLFVSGNNAATKQTLKTIHQVLEQGLRSPYTLKVIDIAQHPEQAEYNQITAIPTLVRVWPQPIKRIVGELEDLSKVLQILANC